MEKVSTAQKEYDFFISYNHKDENYAKWIAWVLEEANYSTLIQAWDFKAGSNFILEMENGAKNSKHTLALLSNNYLQSIYTQPEWAAAFVQDPTGQIQKLIPVRIEDIKLTGLLQPIVYIDLVEKEEDEVRKLILEGVQTGRRKPKTPPVFPGIISRKTESTVEIPENWYDGWLTNRIQELQQEKSYPRIIEGAKLIVHLIPIEAITTKKEYEIKKLEEVSSLKPLFGLQWYHSVNKHGFYTFTKGLGSDMPYGYVQFYRNGIIEAVDTEILGIHRSKYIPGVAFEGYILKGIERSYKNALKEIKIKLPFAICITLVGVEGYYISMDPKFSKEKICDETLRLPTVFVNSWDDNIEGKLRPSFDYLWNTCGVNGSPNYDEYGNWREYRESF
ncbi:MULTISPECIES: toll/interleukin-1 receptor domain-containing protein [Bacillus cereus group]|uniref:toll/interleukin-1 receptor domain-containing protein n=1 Tax=Bacillus cereus group TaxID=86661 RepID=UPI00123B0AAC|nr:toll/interleukin-1 receptor domain-containing protein [Bacillus cereus]KAA6466187.1 toll/interleukin-1 receptor domain-containing protein [Bacillus cereus]KAB2415181.1 toll/interleukin-1 receptor domain-containing protein [Bacillus cereus]KAB2436463.1 toll/interleukin-1 receptor domain-containing protein [Bacillus cereus]KAB2463206.1 toll/interleukin-1 receptor domain-containing protein [Bacillus cereus]